MAAREHPLGTTGPLANLRNGGGIGHQRHDRGKAQRIHPRPGKRPRKPELAAPAGGSGSGVLALGYSTDYPDVAVVFYQEPADPPRNQGVKLLRVRPWGRDNIG